MPMDGTPAPYGVNQVVTGGPVNSDFSQLEFLPSRTGSVCSAREPQSGVRTWYLDSSPLDDVTHFFIASPPPPVGQKEFWP